MKLIASIFCGIYVTIPEKRDFITKKIVRILKSRLTYNRVDNCFFLSIIQNRNR